MDTKRMLTAIAMVTIFIVGYTLFLNYEYKKHPEYLKANQPPPAASQPAAEPSTSAPTTAATTQFTGAASISAATGPAGGYRLIPATSSAGPVFLGSTVNKDATYALGIAISPHEGGVDSVTLNQFNKKVGSANPYSYQQPFDQDLDHSRSLGATRLVVNDSAVNLTGADWNVESSSASSATLGLDIADASGAPVLHVQKIYQIEPRSNDPKSSRGYAVTVQYRFTNLTGGAVARQLAVSLEFNGPTEPPPEVEKGTDRQVIVGYNNDGQIVVYPHPADEFKPGIDPLKLSKSDKGWPMVWAGTSSVYFLAIVQPRDPTQIQEITARALNPDAEATAREVALDFQTTALNVAAGKSTDFSFQVCFAPKDRSLLGDPYYAVFPRQYDQVFKAAASWCAKNCTFDSLTWVLLQMLRGFHFIFRDWGLAIIGLVLVVRLALHPITKKSQVSMMKMTKMQPEVERLKKKFGDDKAGFQKAQMELYKEVGFTPILGCLPMFLQFPIWIALYSALQSEFALRQAPFLWGFTWIKDLARPDMLYVFKQPVPLFLFGMHLSSINLLPLLMMVVTYYSQKYQPQPVAATPEQASQQKMMKVMSMFFPLLFYPMPSGLNLYYMTSMGLGIIESKRIRAHIKQKEEEEKAGKVIIDAKPTRAGKQRQEEAAKAAKPTGMVAGWMIRLQEKAAEMQQDAEKKNKKKK